MTQIPVSRLIEFYNPFESPSPWYDVELDSNQRLSMQVISEAIRRERFISSNCYGEKFDDRICRIAYLVKFGWSDAISLKITSSNCKIEDGNHRFAAAIFRKDTYISCNLSGQVGYCFALFGVKP
jgi:hypothetical protein